MKIRTLLFRVFPLVAVVFTFRESAGFTFSSLSSTVRVIDSTLTLKETNNLPPVWQGTLEIGPDGTVETSGADNWIDFNYGRYRAGGAPSNLNCLLSQQADGSVKIKFPKAYEGRYIGSPSTTVSGIEIEMDTTTATKGHLSGTINFSDSATCTVGANNTLYLDVSGDFGADIELSSGTVELESSLRMKDGHGLVGDGTVILNGHSFDLGDPGSSTTIYNGNITWKNAEEIVLSGDITISGQWTIVGGAVIRGNGHRLIIGSSASFTGASLKIVDAEVVLSSGISNPFQGTATTFCNVTLVFNSDVGFSGATISLEGPNTFVVAHNANDVYEAGNLTINAVANSGAVLWIEGGDYELNTDANGVDDAWMGQGASVNVPWKWICNCKQIWAKIHDLEGRIDALENNEEVEIYDAFKCYDANTTEGTDRIVWYKAGFGVKYGQTLTLSTPVFVSGDIGLCGTLSLASDLHLEGETHIKQVSDCLDSNNCSPVIKANLASGTVTLYLGGDTYLDDSLDLKIGTDGTDVSSDTVIIDGLGHNFTITNGAKITVSASSTLILRNMKLYDYTAAGSIDVSANNSAVIFENCEFHFNGTTSFSSTAQSTISIDGFFDIASGTFKVDSGALNLNAGAIVRVARNTTLNVVGTLTFGTGSSISLNYGNLEIGSSQTLSNGALFVDGVSSLYFNSSQGSLTIDSATFNVVIAPAAVLELQGNITY